MANKNWSQLNAGVRPALGDIVASWQSTDLFQVPASQFAGLGHYVLLDSFAGASDDAKLTNAIAYANAATYTPAIKLSPRLYVFTTNGRLPFDGMVIAGPGDGKYSTASGAAGLRTCEVQLNFDSSSSGIGWFHSPLNVPNSSPAVAQPVIKAVSFIDLAFVDGGGSGHAAFLTQNPGNTKGFQQLLVRNITANGLWGVIGTAAAKVLLTACIFDGNWDLNNGWNTAVHVGGSDNSLWDGGQMLMDSPGAGDAGPHEPAGDGVPHIHLNHLDKTVVGRIYCTCVGKWYALQVDGQQYNSGSSGGNGGPILIRGLVAEGRKIDNPCYGHVVRVDGGLPIFQSCWFGYGMSNPALQGTPGSGTQAAGMIHCTGGMTRIYAPTYGNAAGVATTVPLIYASDAGTLVRARDAAIGTQAGAWLGSLLPATQAANGAPAIDKDNSFA